MADPVDSRADAAVASWVEQIQEGINVESSFERLYKHQHPRLIHYFSRLGFDAGTCEDLTQDVFARVFRNIGSFEHRSSFAQWLFEIAHSTYANEIRRRKTRKRLGAEVPLQEENEPEPEGGAPGGTAPPLAASSPSPYEETAQKEQLKTLREALWTLPPQMRRCVFLRCQQDLKYREVAAILHVKIDTVKAHLAAAKVRLTKSLGGEGGIVRRLSEEPHDAGADNRGMTG